MRAKFLFYFMYSKDVDKNFVLEYFLKIKFSKLFVH